MSAAFSFDGKRIITASADGTARLWDAASGAELRQFEGHTDRVLSATFSRWQTVVTASADRTAACGMPPPALNSASSKDTRTG